MQRSRWLLFLLPLLLNCVQNVDSPPPGDRPAPPAQTQPAARCYVQVFNGSITGGCWDQGCQAPDPVVQVYVANRVVFRTRTLTNTFSPRWDQKSGALTRKELDQARIVLTDQDGRSLALIAEWYVDTSWVLTDPGAGHQVASQYTKHSARLNIAIRCEESPPG